MDDTLNDGGISPNVQEEIPSQGEEMETDIEGVSLDDEESFVDSQESLTVPEEETTSPSGFGVSIPPPVLKVEEVTGAGEMLAQEVQADDYGPGGLSSTDNLLLVGNMFLALILGCICSSIFSRFFRWYI